jgi:hypothetical protein
VRNAIQFEALTKLGIKGFLVGVGRRATVKRGKDVKIVIKKIEF